LRQDSIKKRILLEAAMFFAEKGGEVPKTYKALCNEVPQGKPSAVTRRKWSRYYTSWGHFKKSIEAAYPDLLKLAKDAVEQPKPEAKDPLEALRASTTEK